MKRIKIEIYHVIIFIFAFILIIISHKSLGYVGVGNLYPTEPLTWKEIYDNIPVYLIGSLFFTIAISILYFEGKEEERQEEEKKKRKEEELKNKKTKKEQKETEEK